jgi:hypothetical protein
MYRRIITSCSSELVDLDDGMHTVRRESALSILNFNLGRTKDEPLR